MTSCLPFGYNKLEKEVLESLDDPRTSSAVSDYGGVQTSGGLLEVEASSMTAFQKSDEPCVTDMASMLNEKEMGVHPVFRQDPGDFTKENKSAMQIAELSKARLNLEEMKESDDLQGNLSASNSEVNKLTDTKCPMLYSDMSAEAELAESESLLTVNNQILLIWASLLLYHVC
ncbi:hypothetical protein ACET3Z_006532 [Daucus carota]